MRPVGEVSGKIEARKLAKLGPQRARAREGRDSKRSERSGLTRGRALTRVRLGRREVVEGQSRPRHRQLMRVQVWCRTASSSGRDLVSAYDPLRSFAGPADRLPCVASVWMRSFGTFQKLS